MIANNITAATGSYTWTIPNVNSTNCKIRISDQSDVTVFDISNAVFTIAPPSALTLTQPNGKERWYCGSQHDITWNSQSIADIIIKYSTDNGTSWSLISNVSASTGKYSWTIPDLFTKECKVKIISTSDTSLFDESDNPFTITPTPAITVTSPNGGETWRIGTSENITWTSEYSDSVKIEHCTNGGTNWMVISNSYPADSFKYRWEIPNTISDNCLIKISDAEDPSIFDISDSKFSIDVISSVNNWGKGIPKNFELYQNFPNPFNPVSKIRYQLPKESYVQISLYDILGNEVKKIISDIMNAGYYEFELNGSDLTSGIYFLKMSSNEFNSIKKIILMK